MAFPSSTHGTAANPLSPLSLFSANWNQYHMPYWPHQIFQGPNHKTCVSFIPKLSTNRNPPHRPERAPQRILKFRTVGEKGNPGHSLRFWLGLKSSHITTLIQPYPLDACSASGTVLVVGDTQAKSLPSGTYILGEGAKYKKRNSVWYDVKFYREKLKGLLVGQCIYYQFFLRSHAFFVFCFCFSVFF